ncbi:MAG: AAA family ATPase, partial [Actinobacteria bacterium]|nr:AAA family ATPase [Actinomycetota bacterium]
MAKVLAFANQKGGVAKTTTTINLGVAFQELGYRVLAVDMDPQGNLTMSMGLDPDGGDARVTRLLRISVCPDGGRCRGGHAYQVRRKYVVPV